MIRTITAVLVASLALGAKGGKKSASSGCPFVGVGDIDNSGNVQNVVGLEPKGSVQAFDVDGAVGKLYVTSNGDMHFSGGVPAKVKNSTFTHALLVDGSLKGLHVAEPAKDLPDGIFADAVQIYLADGKGGRVALVSLPGQTEDDACSEIDCKVGGSWKKCWSDCK